MTLHVTNWWSVNRSTARNEAISSWLQLRKIAREEIYINALSRNYRYRGRSKSLTYSECVSAAFVIQHAQRCAILYCDLWPPRLYCFFHIISKKGHNFRKKNYLTQNACFDFLYNFFSEIFLILRRNERYMIKNVYDFHVKCTLLLSDFNRLNPELNPICYLLALLGGHHFLHVSRIRVKSLTFRRLMSYI